MNSENSASKFIDMIFTKLVTQKGDAFNNLTNSEIKYYIYLLGRLCKGSGIFRVLMKYKSKLMTILNLAWKSTDKEIVKAAGKLLKNVTLSIDKANPHRWLFHCQAYIH